MSRSKLCLTILCLSFLKVLTMSSISYACIKYTGKLVDYGADAVHAYAQCKHGPDGNLLLDDFISPFLDDFDKKIILDAGCGAGHWSKLGAQKGGIVHGIDIQSKMIEQAESNIANSALENKIFFQLGDVRALSYPNDFFDRALSINLICNLPGDVDQCEANEGLEAHFSELFRVLKRKGRVIISGPSSMAEILTNGKRPRAEIIEEVKQTLARNQQVFNETTALKFAEQFTDVLRASFILENGQLILVQDKKQLRQGQKVLRKIPGLALFMYYHPEKIVIKELEKAGFKIKKIRRPIMNIEKNIFSNELGVEYTEHNPFFIIEAKKG